MCRIITIDIETLPAPEPKDFAEMTGKKLEDHNKTSLSGDFGRILCIGYIDEDERGNLDSGVIGWNENRQEFTLDEQATLEQFWRMLEGFSSGRDVIVGHNIFDFDLKFIYKRSIICKVRPSVDLSFARYRSQPIFDTMYEWEKWSYGTKISLDKLARVLSHTIAESLGLSRGRIYQAIKGLGLEPIERIGPTTVYSDPQVDQIRAWIKGAQSRRRKRGRSRKTSTIPSPPRNLIKVLASRAPQVPEAEMVRLLRDAGMIHRKHEWR
jgi:hypothetical protein